MGRVRRALSILGAVGLVATGVLAVAGYLLFTRPHSDPLTKADAIVVLGGDNDGRFEYGLSLARAGYANTVVLSNAYLDKPDDLPAFQRACASGTATITVICFVPDPYTTRGEAMYVARLAKQHNWTHVIVVSWNYHMVRARYIFHQCFDGSVTMHPVPRSYDFTPWYWAAQYAYQFGGLVKALLLGCDAR
ncbi:YdcF family protein [Mycolicibacterium sp. P1-5]|uniref:YdcF family protein n=1 Tax=Mycolicibacterium sp. P1-5 TaxID=2024617 RepID=UPI0011F092BC|nr:YdcF family protein [Mycolicibacterium sp. P1-5]KAA0104602.1 YdcF family protein [Mycolicibacterium sp. P1-5]